VTHPSESTEANEASPVPGISRNVFVLGLVSLAADISSEMLYPVLPFFLTGTLGTPVAIVGAIEGVAEGTAALSKVPTGSFSDRMAQRRPLVTLGYCLAAFGKLLLSVATVWPLALVARFGDRLGKGVRGAPRDALLADSSAHDNRGRVFGFHRTMDTTGAVIGPLIGLAMIKLLGEDHLRPVFLLAVVPAVISVLLVGLAHERKRVVEAGSHRAPLNFSGAPTTFWLFLGVSLVFAFGNSSDVFLLLRAENLGMGLTTLILAYVVYNISYAALSLPAGMVSDRVGQRAVLAGGFFMFSLVYLGFAWADRAAWVWLFFAAYGVTLAMTDGVGKALVSNVIPREKRGAFIGLYQSAIGVMIVISSVLAGQLWEHVDPAAPFVLGATTALVAALLLLTLPVHVQREFSA
jgi:MFS family permease